MPDIFGTNGDDDIDVTNSTISGSVQGKVGIDTITVIGSTIGGQVRAGSDDDTVTLQGSVIGTIRLEGGIDVLSFRSTSVSGDVRSGSGTDTLKLPAGTVVNDISFGTFTVSAGTSYSLTSGSFTLLSGISVTFSASKNGSGVPSVTAGTNILAAHGPVQVQDLRTGDLICTAENGNQSIRWIGRRRFDAIDLRANPKLRAVRICAGAFGAGLPTRCLLASRQHRMMVGSRIAQRMFGQYQVLIPAIKLTALPGIFVDCTVDSIEYFHLLLDRHEILFAESAPTESLYTGAEALKSLGPAARTEILEIFPELADENHESEPARLIPINHQQTRLIARHLKNHRPLLVDV